MSRRATGQVIPVRPGEFAIRFYDVDGRRVRHSGFTTEDEARTRLAEHLERVRVHRLGLPRFGSLNGARVYLAWSPLWDPTLCKIGVTTNVEQRMTSLHAEAIVSVPGGRKLEQELLERFAADRVMGEYVRLTASLVALFMRLHAEEQRRAMP